MNRGHSKGYLKHAESLGAVFKVLDAACIFSLLALMTWGYERTSWNAEYALLGLGAVIAFAVISEVVALYRSWRGVPFRIEFSWVAITWVGTLLTLLLIAYVTKTTGGYSRVVVSSWIVITLFSLGGWRIIVRHALSRLRAKGYNTRTVAIIGAGEIGEEVAKTIKESPWLGLNLLGVFDDRVPNSDRLAYDQELQGTSDDLLHLAQRGKVDAIYVTLPLTTKRRVTDLVERLADTTVSVYLVPDFFVYSLFHGQSSHWVNLANLPMISVFDKPFWGFDGWMKRFQDVVLATLILALMSIPMILIAIAVKVTSPGPVLFKQRRYGIDGKEIHVWKFRSMEVQEDGAKVVQTVRHDTRLTKIGGFLRRTSLDELPQFFNALQGDMSIVGPRPHAVAHNEEYRSIIKGYMLRHAVKPGITGWAQISGWRGETDTLDKMEKRVEHDLWYIRNWSLWLDLKIIFLTAFRGFTGKSAY